MQTIEISILHVNNNSFRNPLIIGTFENWTGPEADAALMSVSLVTARESYGRRLSFQEFWSWISDEPPSFSLKTGTKAHTQNMAKWPRVKLKKNKNKKKKMWVKKVVDALGDSWLRHPMTVSS